MNLKEFRKSIYEGFGKMDLELTNGHLSFLSDNVKAYSEFHNKTILDELRRVTRANEQYRTQLFGKDRKKKKTPKTIVKKEIEESKGMFDIPKNIRQ